MSDLVRGAPSAAVDAAVTLVEREKGHREAEKAMANKRRKSALEEKQFDETDAAAELAAILQRNRERAINNEFVDSPLRLIIQSIIGKPEAIDRHEKPPTRIHFIEDSRVVAETEIESRFGNTIAQKVAGWRTVASESGRLPMGQCVYVVHSARMCKIGRSIEIRKRLAAIRMHCPTPVTLLRVVVCGSGHKAPDLVEKELHQAFGARRSHGEWFRLRREDLKYLDASCEPWLVRYVDADLWSDDE